MDWSLGSLKSRHFFLRDKIIFGPPVYYAIIIIDGLARWSWLLLLTSWGTTGIPQIDALIYASVEILRRAMWGVFRVENDHLTNCDNFRAVRDVPLPMEMKEQRGRPLLNKVKSTLQTVRNRPVSLVVTDSD